MLGDPYKDLFASLDRNRLLCAHWDTKRCFLFSTRFQLAGTFSEECLSPPPKSPNAPSAPSRSTLPKSALLAVWNGTSSASSAVSCAQSSSAILRRIVPDLMSANWVLYATVRFSFLEFLFIIKLKMESIHWRIWTRLLVKMFTFHILKILCFPSSIREKWK